MVVTEIAFSRDRYHEHRDMMQWCNDQFGDGCWGDLNGDKEFGITRTGRERWGYSWGGQYSGSFAFQFRNKDDATLFALRWL